MVGQQITQVVFGLVAVEEVRVGMVEAEAQVVRMQMDLEVVDHPMQILIIV
jgi:hypothetical protein